MLRHLWVIDENTGRLARTNRERAIEHVLAIFRGRGTAADTTGNSPAVSTRALQVCVTRPGRTRSRSFASTPPCSYCAAT